MSFCFVSYWRWNRPAILYNFVECVTQNSYCPRGDPLEHAMLACLCSSILLTWRFLKLDHEKWLLLHNLYLLLEFANADVFEMCRKITSCRLWRTPSPFLLIISQFRRQFFLDLYPLFFWPWLCAVALLYCNRIYWQESQSSVQEVYAGLIAVSNRGSFRPYSSKQPSN